MEEIKGNYSGCCPNCGTYLNGVFKKEPIWKGDTLLVEFTCPICYLSGVEYYNVDFDSSVIEAMTEEKREQMINDNIQALRKHEQLIHDIIQAQHDREAEGIKPLF